jgi:signal transduction histidine kinase
MNELLPPPVRETLIADVPILLGRADRDGVIQETEGTLPHVEALGDFEPLRGNLLELFPEDSEEIRDALNGGRARIDVQTGNGDPAHFEMRVVADRKRGTGAYFLVHDVTETRQLELALLDCTDREQVRIGHELHDTLGQELTGIAYQLHALLERIPPQLSGNVSALQQRVSDCLRKARDIAFTLSPHLSGEEIDRAFTRLCAHIGSSFHVECHFVECRAPCRAEEN